MDRHTCVAVATVLLVLSVAGCGDRDASPTDASPTDTSPTDDPTDESAEPSAPPSTDEPSTAVTTPPSEALQKVRVVGEVIEVGDCVVVEDDNAITWTITGERSGELELGARVQVTGTPDLRTQGCGGPIVRARTIVVR